MNRIIQLLILATLMIGCGPSVKDLPDLNQLPDNQPSTEKIEKDLRKLVKEANLSFRTNSNQETYSLLKNSLKGFDAYISEENSFNYRNRTGFDLIIRVPAERFDSLLNFIVSNVKIKELDNKSTQIKDVTEEFIDFQARIKIKKESEQVLTALLLQSKNLSETLEIQKQLTDLRTDIESVEGRLKYLTDQVNFSTIRVSFYENIKYSKRFFTDFWDALKVGWQVFLHILTILAYLWVVVLIFFVIIFGSKYLKKRNVDKR
ncbi:MAG: DUF4349 domain-containing protein [Bacteroidetes bacterium HGW-Bacteroidetes-22]|nr:MAG: DUF4349 domain-containing protein [Bacteroidetes bacterium HGW-Bacteroidetes-22]